MKPDLQIAYLKTLIAIDEEGGFGAAAKRIGRTQSAVTQQMQALERIAGVPLFVTNGRRRDLTEAGRTLLRHGQEILSLCNHAISASQRSRNSGVLRIGAPQEIAEELLPQVLAAFEKDWPDLRIVVQVDRSPNLMHKLEEDLLDLTLSTRRSSNYDSHLLLQTPVLWIASQDWRHDPSQPVPLVLSDEPSMFRRIALAALDLNGQTYVERLTSPSLAGVRLAVKSGLGITARTRSSFFADTKVLSERHGLPSLPDVSYYLHRPLHQNSAAADSFSEILLRISSAGL